MEKALLVTMPDQSIWRVPASVVADDRARYYADKEHRLTQGSPRWQHVYDEEYALTLRDHDELLDWAANNMNWTDVASHAALVPHPPRQLTPSEFQEGWANGDKQIVEEEAE